MGEMEVPSDVLYGASTQRAVLNFPVSGRRVHDDVIRAFAMLKGSAASVNAGLGKLDQDRADAVMSACRQILHGLDDRGGLGRHFPIDIFQTGSGTSTNMNVNEVVANLVCLARGAEIGSSKDNAYLEAGGVHPNDHVNMGQSSNDTFPTAMHIAGALLIENALRPALSKLQGELDNKAKALDSLIKTGRTHLMDATPIRMGQVFAGYAQQVKLGNDRAGWAAREMLVNMPIGGTAVGTGINTFTGFAERVCAVLSKSLGLSFTESDNHPEAQAAKDSFVSAHGYLKTIAVSLSKIANDIRHLGSGPRCGIGELNLPAIQPGSSIMPGKVNPVVCESVMQVACRVIGNDTTVTMAGMGGVGSIFELNVAMPVMIDAFLESVSLLANVSNVFVDKLLVDLEVNEARCTELLESSLMTITALAPEIGYDKCAALAKQAHKEGKTIKQIVSEQNLMPAERLAELMDYDSMTRPG